MARLEQKFNAATLSRGTLAFGMLVAMVAGGACGSAPTSVTTVEPWRVNIATSLLSQVELGGELPRIIALAPQADPLPTASAVWMLTFAGQEVAVDDGLSQSVWAQLNRSGDGQAMSREQALYAAARLLAATGPRFKSDGEALYHSSLADQSGSVIGRVRLAELRSALLESGSTAADLPVGDNAEVDCDALNRSLALLDPHSTTVPMLLAIAAVSQSAALSPTCRVAVDTWRHAQPALHAIIAEGGTDPTAPSADPLVVSQLVALEADYDDSNHYVEIATDIAITTRLIGDLYADHPVASPGHLTELVPLLQFVADANRACGACATEAVNALRYRVSASSVPVAQRTLTLGGRLVDVGEGDPAEAALAIASLRLLRDTASSESFQLFTVAVAESTHLAAIGDLSPTSAATVLLFLDSGATRADLAHSAVEGLVHLLASGPASTRRAPLELAALAQRYGLDACSAIAPFRQRIIDSLVGATPAESRPQPAPSPASVAALTASLAACDPTLRQLATDTDAAAIAQLSQDNSGLTPEEAIWLAGYACATVDARTDIDFGALAEQARNGAMRDGVASVPGAYVALLLYDIAEDPCAAASWWHHP